MAFRNLFKTKKETNSDKINSLCERVVILQQERDKVFGDVEVFEKREADLLQQGKDSKSMVARKRLAQQLNQVRKDLGRRNSMAAMSNRQIDILNSDIHNLTLIQQGNAASIGDIQDITDNAVKAEQIMEDLTADAELASNVLGIVDDMNEEELAILAEFKGEESKPEAAPESNPIFDTQDQIDRRKEDADERIAKVERSLMRDHSA